MNTFLLTNIIFFIGVLVLIWAVARFTTWSLSRKVLLAMVIGVAFGATLQSIYGNDSTVLKATYPWFALVGKGYVRLLQMIIMPLVLISIVSAIAKLYNASALGKISFFTIGFLLLTTAIAAAIGIAVTYLFGLSAIGLEQGVPETQRITQIEGSLLGKVENLQLPEVLLNFIPTNAFLELTGDKPTSLISVVIFAIFLGLAAIRLVREDAPKGQQLITAIEIMQAWVMKLVRIIMLLTPYGVFALMTLLVANSQMADVLRLLLFIVASYVGLITIVAVHAVFLSLVRVNPWTFFKKISSVLSFAFTSRSSAATIPLSIEAQTQRLGIPSTIASFAASFGATIGQNGCAGLYPAMLAVMVAPTVGINPFDPLWMLTLVGVVTLSSAGVAGVGGGATYAALIVLPTLGLPVTLVGLLVSIEPIIDMGRTAVNVSGSMTAGMVTSQILKQTEKVE